MKIKTNWEPGRYPGTQYIFSVDKLHEQNISATYNAEMNAYIFEDQNEPMQLFDTDAITQLVKQFGDTRTDSILDAATHIVSVEIFAERMKKVLR